MKITRSRITQEKFEAVKTLKKAGVSSKAIAKALGIGKSTTQMLIRFETLDEYREWQKENAERTKQRQSQPVEVEHYIDKTDEWLKEQFETNPYAEFHDELKVINERLQDMQEKLTFLYEHTPVSTKRKWGL
jgi:IS30 family transposase